MPEFRHRQAYGYKRQRTRGLDLIWFILNEQKMVDFERYGLLPPDKGLEVNGCKSVFLLEDLVVCGVVMRVLR